VIYYWWVAKDQLYMLFAYPKNVQDDLTPEQIKRLAEAVRREVKDG
jgi:dihydrodipicolinate synthase/N-acetylneuraminate lyase